MDRVLERQALIGRPGHLVAEDASKVTSPCGVMKRWRAPRGPLGADLQPSYRTVKTLPSRAGVAGAKRASDSTTLMPRNRAACPSAMRAWYQDRGEQSTECGRGFSDPDGQNALSVGHGHDGYPSVCRRPPLTKRPRRGRGGSWFPTRRWGTRYTRWRGAVNEESFAGPPCPAPRQPTRVHAARRACRTRSMGFRPPEESPLFPVVRTGVGRVGRGGFKAASCAGNPKTRRRSRGAGASRGRVTSLVPSARRTASTRTPNRSRTRASRSDWSPAPRGRESHLAHLGQDVGSRRTRADGRSMAWRKRSGRRPHAPRAAPGCQRLLYEVRRPLQPGLDDALAPAAPQPSLFLRRSARARIGISRCRLRAVARSRTSLRPP